MSESLFFPTQPTLDFLVHINMKRKKKEGRLQEITKKILHYYFFIGNFNLIPEVVVFYII
jgi:hypothetical protein